MTANELKTRTQAFGLRVIGLFRSLAKDEVARIIGRQLVRSGTSVGSNYRSACRAKSAADFVSKMGVVEEEADESGYWIEMLRDAKLVRPDLLGPLLKEANELCAIASSSRITARKKIPSKSPPPRKSTIDNRQSTIRRGTA